MCLFQYNEFFRQVAGLLKQSLVKNPTDSGRPTVLPESQLNVIKE